MTLSTLVKKSRSFRRFNPKELIPPEQLEHWVDTARLCPSGGNLQPLKYRICTGSTCNSVFPHLTWAGYLKDWDGPKPEEQPPAYIVILGDSTLSKNFGVDHGIAAQTILLSAAEAGFGGCMIGALDRPALHRDLDLPQHLDILLVLALGKPAESVVLEPVQNENIKYRRDEHGIHYVPKRTLAEILISGSNPPCR